MFARQEALGPSLYQMQGYTFICQSVVHMLPWQSISATTIFFQSVNIHANVDTSEDSWKYIFIYIL